MYASASGFSKRNKVGIATGIIIAIPTLFLYRLDGLAADLATAFAFPGIMISMILTLNLHDGPLWLAAIANIVFYFLLARILGSLVDLFRSKSVPSS